MHVEPEVTQLGNGEDSRAFGQASGLDASPNLWDVAGERPEPLLTEWNAVPTAVVPERWEELVTWVRWLRGRYRLNVEERLPECWPLHPELIEELTALKAAREEAYGRGSASGAAAVAWQQALAAFLSRTASLWARGCRAGHKPHAIDWDGEREQALTDRWDAADPLVGLPPDYPRGVDPNDSVVEDASLRNLRMAGERIDALLATGAARAFGEEVPDLVQWDGDWWVLAPDAAYGTDPVWLRIVDRELAMTLDDHACRMAAADAAVGAMGRSTAAVSSPDGFPPSYPRPQEA